ncbi:DNRLRE domain-containing protein [Nannocystis sp. SCPEA4]|uniref:DNRLRE domain-containing protein n=1 Tax=Nannocystis sp. SCPEA4 TaxID=2996787 RepID=UPI00227186AA|nr:DNRLRE domain-containing protein [Nannocystis sp. SCPEA4]MCY1054571.1 DNRLRE domain-containing protein [Nannocystis sp. SCPEA4]
MTRPRFVSSILGLAAAFACESLEEPDVSYESIDSLEDREPGDGFDPADHALTDLAAETPETEAPPPFPQALLVSPTAAWTFLVQPSENSGANCRVPADSTWRSSTTFTDTPAAGWASGFAELGYGDGDERTEIPFGDDPDDKCITQYFRHEFTVSNPNLYSTLTVRLLRDDGAAVYINGNLVVRSNLPSSFNSETVASSTVEDSAEDTFFVFSGIANNLVTGTNLIAVEVHQRSDTNPDVSFALELDANLAPPAVGVTRTTLTFASDEATIDEDSRNTNFGSSSVCRIDGASGENNSSTDEQVCLARWNITAIPAGATIRAAHLDTNVTNTTPDRYGLHVLKTDWVESRVTWEDRNGSLTGDWTSPGGTSNGQFGINDFEAEPVTVVNALATGERIIALPPDLIRRWRALELPNFGLAFLDFIDENGLDFSTSGAGIELVVTFDQP